MIKKEPKTHRTNPRRQRRGRRAIKALIELRKAFSIP